MTANFLHFFRKYLLIVYQEKTAYLRSLRDRMTEATAAAAEVMFVNSWCEIEHCFDVCMAADDIYIETFR
jgi:hypothetical protein